MTSDINAYSPRRRRISRKAIARHIADAPLPDDVRNVIHYITFRTHLWKHEQLDVANELIAHFSDGIDDGQSSAELVTSFGDPKQAAKLIRRSKLRHRTAWWQALQRARRAFIVLLAIYVILGIRFTLSQPTISTNYAASINTAAEAIPGHERAWPLYQAVIASLKADPFPSQVRLHDRNPDSSDLKHLATWVARHETDLAALREGSRRPRLGRTLPTTDFVPAPSSQTSYTPPWMPLSHLTNGADLLFCIDLLWADNHLAVHRNSPDRFYDNCITLLKISRQTRDDIVDVQWQGMQFRFVAVYNLRRILATHPTFLSNDQLRLLAHEVSDANVAGDIINADRDIIILQDVLQRSFTDNGHGNGRITSQGFQYFSRHSTPSWYEQMLSAIIGPALSPLLGSRKDYIDRYFRITANLQEAMSQPLFATGNVDSLQESPDLFFARSIADYAISQLVRKLEIIRHNAERGLGQNDGLRIGIALELYFRAHDKYPARLNELVPAYLSVLPIDRITGRPLLYRLSDNCPVMYSVGEDLIDNGGLPPILRSTILIDGHRFTESDLLRTARWHEKDIFSSIQGDWILWPPAAAFNGASGSSD